MDIICKNCDNIFVGSYCNQCGQTAHTHRLDWHFIQHNLEHAIFHFERGIFFTIKEISLNPGRVVKLFFAGKRVRLTPPLSYLILIHVVYYLFVHYLLPQDVLFYDSKVAETFSKFIIQYLDKLLLVIVIPLTALYTMLLFPKNPYNFFELFAFHCYLRGQFLLLEMLVLLIDWILVHLNIFLSPVTLKVVIASGNFLYLTYGLSQLFDGMGYNRVILLRALGLLAMVVLSAALLGGIAAGILGILTAD